jgi:hypothetical protein
LPLPGTGPCALGGYRGVMGRIFLILIAGLAVFVVASVIIATVFAALHLFFWLALIAVLVIGVMHFSRGSRRRARR